MNLEETTRLKNWLAKIAAAFCFLFILCGVDGGVAYLREPLNSLRLLPGESIRLTGPLAPGATLPDHMTFESSSDSVAMSIEEVISGFFLGGQMWRGTLRLAPDAKPGEYLIAVFGKSDLKKVGSNLFQVIVYGDRASYLAASKSLLLRYSGVSAWAWSGGFLGLVLLCCGGLYLLGLKIDRLMADEGEAEVYLVTKDELGFSLYFALGERNGIAKGSRLILMDPKRRPIEEITVESVSETDALARIGPLGTVTPGYLVKKV
ncbi:MAG: hypothetical protein WAW37_19220 [Syntrophobacteraceae bacterium]